MLTRALKLSFLFVVDKVLHFIKDKKTHDNNNQSKLCQQIKLILRIQLDVLGEGYEQLKLSFPDDYEGAVCATPRTQKSPAKILKKAVLYIHGFIDYFFKPKMAEQFNQHGYDFYALDLSKYGRSYFSHQKYYNVRDLSEYDAEITQALEIIGNEGHTAVLLAGHSTGWLNHDFIRCTQS